MSFHFPSRWLQDWEYFPSRWLQDWECAPRGESFHHLQFSPREAFQSARAAQQFQAIIDFKPSTISSHHRLKLGTQ
jgi:hypothetical protein